MFCIDPRHPLSYRRSLSAKLLLAPGMVLWGLPALAQTADQAPTPAETLPPVQVQGTTVPVQETTAGPVQGFRALTAKSSTRTSTPIEQLPQNIGIVTRSLIDSQLSITLSDAVRNISNVQPLDSRIIGNVEQAPVKIRGFGAEQWTDGYPGNLFLSGNRDGLVNVERIEVLKGPNSVVYGGGAGAPVGGAINVVSKMPTDKARYEVGGIAGSYSYGNPYIDFNQPLTSDGTALFRLTSEFISNNSFSNVLDAQRFSINPTLTLTNRSTTSLTIQGFISQFYQQAYPGLPVTGTLLGNYRVDSSLYFGIPNIPKSYANISGITATLDHRFDDIWSANVKARWSQSDSRQYSQSAFLDPTGTGGTPFLPPSTFDVNNIDVAASQEEVSINPTVQAKFTAGPTSNTFLLGGDYSRVKDWGFMNVDTQGNFCFLIGFGCQPSTVNLQNPAFSTPYSNPVVGVGEAASLFSYNNTYVTWGVYGQLQSSFYERFHLLLGARVATMNISYTEYAVTPATYLTDATRFLPRAGLVVDIAKGVSIYGNYSQGMRWVPFSQTFAQPAPEFSTQFEAGVKVNYNDIFTGTVALFQIERSNVPVRISATVANLTQQASRGVEADFLYQPNRNWSVLASYGFTNAYFADPAGTGIPAGNLLPFVPAHSGRLWATYKVDQGILSGFSAGAGIYAASGQYVDAANQWATGGYYTIDAKVGYDNERVRAALSVKNLTDNRYFVPYQWLGGQVAPGSPLMVYGQFALKW